VVKRSPTSEDYAWADWLHEMGATHAITFVPDIRPGSVAIGTNHFRQFLKRLLVRSSQHLLGVPNRARRNLDADQVLWLVGWVEETDAAGLPYPHFHGAIRCPASEDQMRGFLRTFWGQEDHECAHLPACIRDEWLGDRPVPNRRLAPRPVFRRPGVTPEFSLKPLRDAPGWVAYSRKKEGDFWASADILGTPATAI
jgi:hypothetical protein